MSILDKVIKGAVDAVISSAKSQANSHAHSRNLNQEQRDNWSKINDGLGRLQDTYRNNVYKHNNNQSSKADYEYASNYSHGGYSGMVSDSTRALAKEIKITKIDPANVRGKTNDEVKAMKQAMRERNKSIDQARQAVEQARQVVEQEEKHKETLKKVLSTISDMKARGCAEKRIRSKISHDYGREYVKYV